MRVVRDAYVIGPAHRCEAGVTLIDTIVGTALMLVVFLGIAAAFKLSVDVVTNNKARAGAIALGNERMEYLRSLSYTQIGVQGGIPAGTVPQQETVNYNGTSYARRTMVWYSDDPGDGLGAADTNGIITDYKTIRVEVNWESKQGQRSIVLVGRVSPFGVETAVAGGILTISVVDEASQPVSDAQVDIANTGVVPAINIRTYTNTSGIVSFIGAPAASDYQIVVSKSGYSSAQTYSVSANNPNPVPRHLTVANNQTTTATFTIDHTATKIVQIYLQVQGGTWADTMVNTNHVASAASTTISGGAARLAGSPGSYEADGWMRSTAIAPSDLNMWGTFNATTSAPAQTGLAFRFYDGGTSTLLPEGVLPGNAAGFTAGPVDLSGLSTTTYQSLVIETSMTSANPDATPTVDEYAIAYQYGPTPLSNLSFEIHGAKTIGNNPTVYKYNETQSSGATASLTFSDFEADTYTLSVATSTGYMLAESCDPQPETLAPSATQTTRLYVLPATPHSLLVDVRGSGNALLSGVVVQAVYQSYDTSKTTSGCGQAFFEGLTTGTYAITATKSGYQPATTNVSVNGLARLSLVLAPQ